MISIVMPVYNGEKYILKSIEITKSYMNKLDEPYEIIVVDDGSKDDTYKKVLAIVNSNNIRVFRYPINKGKGYAFIYGVLRSKGERIVLFDSDLDISPYQIGFLLKILRRSNADIVITDKWHFQSKVIASSLRKFLSKMFNMLVRLLTGLKIQDTQTGAKIFKKKALLRIIKHVYIKRYTFDVELLLIADQLGYKIIEVPSLKPIVLTSKFRIKEIIYMLLELFSITYRHKLLYHSSRGNK